MFCWESQCNFLELELSGKVAKPALFSVPPSPPCTRGKWTFLCICYLVCAAAFISVLLLLIFGALLISKLCAIVQYIKSKVSALSVVCICCCTSCIFEKLSTFTKWDAFGTVKLSNCQATLERIGKWVFLCLQLYWKISLYLYWFFSRDFFVRLKFYVRLKFFFQPKVWDSCAICESLLTVRSTHRAPAQCCTHHCTHRGLYPLWSKYWIKQIPSSIPRLT